MIKLIAFDMDGTFLHSDNSYDRSRFKDIYEKLKEKGIKVVVISGNQYAQLTSFFPDYKDDLIFVSENGALIFENGSLLEEKKIEPEEIVSILAVLEREGLAESAVLCGLKSAYVLESSPKDSKKEIGIYYHALKELASFDQLPEDDFVKLALLVSEEKTESLLEIINQACSQQVEAVSSGHGSIDIIQKGVHKGAALEYLSSHLEIAPEEMMAFGDGGNDLEMLEYVGHSYAMANAPQPIKERAKNQAPSNQDSGVLAIIEREVLT